MEGGEFAELAALLAAHADIRSALYPYSHAVSHALLIAVAYGREVERRRDRARWDNLGDPDAPWNGSESPW